MKGHGHLMLLLNPLHVQAIVPLYPLLGIRQYLPGATGM